MTPASNNRFMDAPTHQYTTEPARAKSAAFVSTWLTKKIQLCATWRSLLVMCLLALSTACAGPQSNQTQRYNSGIAVVGVTAAAGLGISFDRSLLSRDFAELLAARDSFSVTPASSVRQYIGPARAEELMAGYAKTGQLTDKDIQRLIDAGLPARHAVIARVERDQVQKLPARREPVLNQAGKALADRERRVMGTQRTTSLSAMLIDLRTGRQVWEQQYQVDPIVEIASTHYLGSSFSGSLAAAFANTVVNGVRLAPHPKAPPLRTSLQTLLREVTGKLPTR